MGARWSRQRMSRVKWAIEMSDLDELQEIFDRNLAWCSKNIDTITDSFLFRINYQPPANWHMISMDEVDILRFLLDKGASAIRVMGELSSRQRSCPGYEAMLCLTIEYGAVPEDNWVLYAIRHCHDYPRIPLILLRAPLYKPAPNLLIHALKYSANRETIEKICDIGIALNINWLGLPVHMVVRHRNVETLKIFADKHFWLSDHDGYGNTPLDLICAKEARGDALDNVDMDMMEILLRGGVESSNRPCVSMKLILLKQYLADVGVPEELLTGVNESLLYPIGTTVTMTSNINGNVVKHNTRALSTTIRSARGAFTISVTAGRLNVAPKTSLLRAAAARREPTPVPSHNTWSLSDSSSGSY
jgi:hypothetical protein